MPLCNLWETSAPPKLLWVRCILWEDAVCCLAGAVGTTAPPKDCHATATRLPRYCKMPRNGWKISWKIGWKITSFFRNLPAFIFLTCSTLHSGWKIW